MAYSNAGYNISVNGSISLVNGNTTNVITTNSSRSNSFTIGSAAGNVDQIYDASGTVASSGSATTIDLSTALNTAGVALGMLHAVLLFFQNLDPSNTLTIKPAVSDGVTWLPSAGVVCPPGAFFMIGADAIPGGAAVAGFAIVASTSDSITIATGGGTNVPYKLTIQGRDA